jgi:hypothetical protein
VNTKDHKPGEEKVCTGRDLAAALAGVELSEEEAKAWHRDLLAARRMLMPSSARESARELASLGGTMPHLKKIPRRRARPK